MVINGKLTKCVDHFTMYINIESMYINIDH